MTRRERQIREWLARAVSRAAEHAVLVLGYSPEYIEPAPEPAPTVSEDLAARLERAERREAEQAQKLELLARIEAQFDENRRTRDEDQRPPEVIAAWLEVAS